MAMPRAGEGVGGGPARYSHGWKPVNPQIAASMERIRAKRGTLGEPGPKGTSFAHTQVFHPAVTPLDRVRAARDAGKVNPRHYSARGRYVPTNSKSLGESVAPNIDDMTAEALGGGRPYSAAFITPDGHFTPEREALHRKIIEDHLAGISPTGKQPIQYMNGGGPGSGKSTLRAGDNAKLTGYPPTREVDDMTGKLDLSQPAEAALIDPDAVKIMLPEVQAARARGDTDWAAKSHEESSYLAKRIHQAAVDRGLDLIYDGTGDSGVKGMEKKVAVGRSAGYRMEANYIYLDPKEGEARAKFRAGKTGRVVNEDFLRNTYKDVSGTFGDLAQRGTFDVLRVFDNNQARGVPATPIAEFHGKLGNIRDPAAYQRFLAVGN